MFHVDDVHLGSTTGEVRVPGGEGQTRVVAHVGAGCDEVGDGDFEGGGGVEGGRARGPFGVGLIGAERAHVADCGREGVERGGGEAEGRELRP